MTWNVSSLIGLCHEVKAKHKIGRSSICREAVRLCPELAGGFGSPNYIKRLHKWYYEFCDAFEVNPRKKICSVGQKLPTGDLQLLAQP